MEFIFEKLCGLGLKMLQGDGRSPRRGEDYSWYYCNAACGVKKSGEEVRGR